jgi:hypothetical protein
MRSTLAVLIAAGGMVAASSAAQAAPVVLHDGMSAAPPAGIVQVWGGCGPGWRPVTWQDRWGRWRHRCVPARRW